jgi:ankyrin repeat protein
MRVIPAVAVLLLSVAAFAQSPATDDRFYRVIREDDLVTLRTLVRDRGVDTKDAQGQTPLMLAAAFGSRESVRILLDSKADVRAVGTGGVTALHLATMDSSKTRWLLDAGADVNAVSQLGRTPLVVAASGQGTVDVVRQLLAKGASVNAADAVGITPLIAAASVNDADVVNLLLAHGADASAASRGPVGTALQGAAANGNSALVKTLLARSSNVDAVSVDSAGTVKNGPVQFGHVTALHLAVLSVNRDAVRQILAAGASVDALDIRGMTPLMFAIGTDRPDPRIVRMLLQRGASTTLRSKAGESAIDWARRFQNPEILAELKLPGAVTHGAGTLRSPRLAQTVAAHEPTARAAVERSLPTLGAASGRMLTDGGCVACHAQPLTGVAVTLASAMGWTTASAAGDSAQALITLTANAPGLLQFRDGGGLPDTLVYASFLLAAGGTPPGRATDVLVNYLAAKQRPEGNWKGTGATRAPMQDGNFSRTALSIRALTAFGTPARVGEYKARVDRAATWLAAQAPVSTEDRVMQLLGLHWANADAVARQRPMQQLRALQHGDGGWAQTPHLESDAYATGQVLYTLRQLGVAAADPALQRGAAFLLRTQQEDGSWRVKSRAMKIQPYFESGFPYEHDQWISHAATAWATMALTVTARDQASVRAAAVR